MRFRHVAIESVAYEVPPVRVPSAQLEERLNGALLRMKLPPRPIELLTGIAERRFWDDATSAADAAGIAASKALAAAGIPKEKLGLLISTSVSKDFLEPSMAAFIHGSLGLPASCRGFDVGNACLGFLNGIELAGQAIDAGQVDYALVVAGESAGPIVDATIERLHAPETTAAEFWSNFATLTLGSAAVAMVLSHERLSRTSHRVMGSVSLSDTKNNRLCIGTKERMVTDSTTLLRAGVALARQTWEEASIRLDDWADDRIDHYVCHQVGRAHINALCQALGMSQAKCHLTYPSAGNIGPAAVPYTLAVATEAGRVKPGQHVALMGIGSGLNVAMMSVRW